MALGCWSVFVRWCQAVRHVMREDAGFIWTSILGSHDNPEMSTGIFHGVRRPKSFNSSVRTGDKVRMEKATPSIHG